jgi:hypothetical protein
MYQERLSQLGLKSLVVHTTRLKEKLLNKMPGLSAITSPALDFTSNCSSWRVAAQSRNF